MKFLALAAASATAVAAQTTVGPCDLTKLLPIAQGNNGKKCTADTGYGLVPPQLPTDAQLPKVCTNTACNALLGELVAAVPVDCQVTTLKLKSELLDVLPGMCAKYKDATPAPTTTAPGATTAAPGATTATPGATTKAPDTTSKTPSTSSEAPTATPANSTAPAATTAAPEATTEAPESTTEAPAEGSTSMAGSSSEDTDIDAVSSPSATTSVPATTKPADSSASKTAAAAGAVVVGAIALLL